MTKQSIGSSINTSCENQYITISTMEADTDMKFIQSTVDIKESLEELKPETLKSCWKNLDEESMQIQTLQTLLKL